MILMGLVRILPVCTSVITSCISLEFFYLAEIFSVDIL